MATESLEARPARLPSNPGASSCIPGTLSRREIERRIIAGIARVRAADISEIEQAVRDGGGDLVIDSKEGEAVIGKLEGDLGQRLPGPADLEPDEYTSVRTLADLVERKLQESC